MAAVIVGYVRTPFHRSHKGSLHETRPEDMLAAVIDEMLSRTGIKFS